MKKYIIAATLVVSGAAFASDCPQFYPNNTPIEIPGTVELCNDFFVVRYNPTLKAVILTSEILDTKHTNVPRVDAFHPDDRLRKGERAEVSDYAKTGYDKGHMVPADDAASPTEMHNTFVMTNMTPQVPELNRGPWRELEMMVRTKAGRNGVKTWVVTGASYTDTPVTIGKNKIPVPTGYYKVGYFAEGTKAWYAHNTTPPSIVGTTVKDVNHFASVTLPE